LGENLDQLVGLIPLAKASKKRITENFQIATFYNVIAVPVAIAGFATPLIAALVMSLSSISVTLNVFYQEPGVKTKNLTR
jgi:Cu2+-exporting ATPase